MIASSGSAIGSKLVVDVLDHFGPVLYNLYGSTEVAIATIADPTDLRAAPNTAGRVAFGVNVEIVDPQGTPVPKGEVGRVFVGGSMKFDGYTNGDDKERLRGLLSSGDMGYFRDDLLFIEGRDDDMIVSGGENVFPSEIEELLAHHPAVADVAVVGVPDDEFGQVLAAFVVLRPGDRLTRQQVRDHVKANLARHKVPRDVSFVDELPRNTTGKLLRRTLTDHPDRGARGVQVLRTVYRLAGGHVGEMRGQARVGSTTIRRASGCRSGRGPTSARCYPIRRHRSGGTSHGRTERSPAGATARSTGSASRNTRSASGGPRSSAASVATAI